jgi:hypothetical protein
MREQIFFILLFFVSLISKSWSQVSITTPKLIFEDNQLVISYDLISKTQSDKFYVWVEMEKKNGERIEPKALSGDIGDVKAGKDKKIIWVPEKDSVYIDEEMSVEIKAEKYGELFNKGNLILLSAAVPGLGQTKISKGKPYWLTALAAYGALAGGIISHSSYIKNYDGYRMEEDISKRADLYNQAQMQMNTSRVLLVSSAALWTANIIWVTMMPNMYKPLQHLSFSLEKTPGYFKGTTLLTMKFHF